MSGDPHSDIVSERKPRVGCVFVSIIIFGVLLVGGLLAIVGWEVAAARRVARLKADIAAQGEPVSADQLAAWYVVPEGRQDCTAEWLAAAAILTSQEFGLDAQDLPGIAKASEWPDPAEPWGQLAAAEALLTKYQDAIRRLHAAAERGGAARYPINFAAVSHPLELEHLQSLDRAARVLVLEAHVRARRGDAASVARSIRTMIALANSLENEPVLVSHLARIGVSRMTTDVCRKMLPAVEFSDRELQEVSADFRRCNFSDGFHQAMLGERVRGITAFERPETLGESLPRTIMLTPNDDLSQYLELLNGVVAAGETPHLQDTAINRLRYPLTRAMLPPVDACVVVGARRQLDVSATVTAIAIERYRRKTGALPARLDQLVPEFLPEVPVDLFDRQPLRYVVREQEYLLYSVGRDGVDDGGQADRQQDNVFPVKRVAPGKKTRRGL